MSKKTSPRGPGRDTDRPAGGGAPKRRRWKLRLTAAILAAATLAAVFCIGLSLGGRESPPEITSDLLRQELREVQDLVSVEYHYTNMGKFENSLDFYGWSVPFTTKTFLVSYDGVIKAGVDLSSVEVTVDQEAKTVTVTLPQGRIVSHEIPEDTIQVFDESRNIFNPISIQDYTGFTQDQKAAVEQKAIDNGLLDEARDRAALAVSALLGRVSGMELYTLTVQ